MTQCSLGHQLAWHMFVDRHVCIHPSSPPRLGKAKSCWTLNGKALQRNALVRNICMSDSSAWNSGGVACSSPATHWETLSTAEWVQQEVTEAAFRGSFGESPRVLGMWARTLLWVTAWLIWFCLFTRIYKNTWFHCFFFSPSWTSWSAQRLQCSQAHLLQRCLPACFNTLLTSIDICVKRDLMHWENEAHDLHVQLLNGLDKIKHLHPVKFTWVMWNANTALWTPDSEVMQQGVVNMSWQVHQRSVDFPQNNKQQRYFHSAWDILSFDRIIFWEYKTHKEVSILPNLLFIIFAVLYWFPNLFILRFLAGFCSVLRTFTFPFTDISWTSYICHSSLGISCHLKPVQMVRT